jgi:hypothetical protein
MRGFRSKNIPSIWKSLSFLGCKQGSVRIKDLSAHLGLSEEETLIFLRQMFPNGTGAEIYQKESEAWVDLNANSIEYVLPLNPSEWVALRDLVLREKEDLENEAFTSLRKKVLDNAPVQVMMDILGQLEEWDHQLTEEQVSLVSVLEKAIESKSLLEVTLREGKKYMLFPCRILHLEGFLSFIAEDFYDHCLTVFSVQNVTGLDLKETNKLCRVTAFEIEEFITAVRSMNDRETRLILKIHNPHSANLFPQYHFLGKPCMITNPNGDLIWAAYVEACDPLYEWLLSLGTDVEILDPSTFKSDYLSYCEAKIKKIA